MKKLLLPQALSSHTKEPEPGRTSADVTSLEDAGSINSVSSVGKKSRVLLRNLHILCGDIIRYNSVYLALRDPIIVFSSSYHRRL